MAFTAWFLTLHTLAGFFVFFPDSFYHWLSFHLFFFSSVRICLVFILFCVCSSSFERFKIVPFESDHWIIVHKNFERIVWPFSPLSLPLSQKKIIVFWVIKHTVLNFDKKKKKRNPRTRFQFAYQLFDSSSSTMFSDTFFFFTSPPPFLLAVFVSFCNFFFFGISNDQFLCLYYVNVERIVFDSLWIIRSFTSG